MKTIFFVMFSSSVLFVSTGFAEDYDNYWVGTESTGNWGDSSNWAFGVPNANDVIAMFYEVPPPTPPTSLTVTVNGTYIASQVLFNSTTVSLTGGILNLGGGTSEQQIFAQGAADYFLGTSMNLGIDVTTINVEISGVSTLELTENNVFSSSNPVNMTIYGVFRPGAYSNAISSFSETGTIAMSTGGTLTIGNGNTLTYPGNLTGGGGITLSSDTKLTLTPPESAPNNYSGTTLISDGAILYAGSSNAFSPESSYTVDGSLNLNGYSNTVLSITGSGTISLLNNETLTIISSEGTTFSGRITGGGGGGGITLSNGAALTLAPPDTALNNYSGTTLISDGAELLAGSSGAFSPNSSYTVTGLLDPYGYSNTIFSLFGDGLVYSTFLATLTVKDGGTFSGVMAGLMNLAVTGGTLTFSGDSNVYEGFTQIQGGTLIASANGALSSKSNILLEASSTTSLLQIGTTTQRIAGLSGEGAVEIASGGSLTFRGVGLGNFNGSITGPSGATGGAIIKDGLETVTFSGIANLESTTIASGRMNIDATLWSSSLITVENNAILGGIGTLDGPVTLTNRAIIAPGHSSGTLTFTSGNTVTFNSGSIYLVSIDTQGASDLILASDTLLKGNLRVAVPSHFVPKQSRYPIIEMIEGASYSGAFVVQELSGYQITVNYPSSTLVELTLAVSAIPTATVTAMTGNQSTLASYINGFPDALVYLNQLPFGELEQALDRISPARNYANAFALQNTTFAFSYELGSHLRNRRLLKQKTPSIELALNEQLFAMADECEMPSETLPADLQNEEMKEDSNSQNEEPNLYPQPGTPILVKPLPNHYQVWISGFGEFSHQNATASNHNPAFHFNAAGPLVGLDFGGESGLMGAAGGYAKNTIQMAGDFGSASSDSAIFMVYGSYYGTPFFFDLSLLIGGSWFKTNRNISFPEFSAVATEKHSAWALDPHLDFGYYFDFGMLGLEPYASLDAAIVFEEEYSETGAYPYNFSQSSHNSELLRSEVGLASYQQKSFWGVTLLFKESLSYVNKTPWGNMTTGFVGSPTSITLETISGTQNLISPTFEFLIQWDEFTFSAMYEGEFGSQYHSNEVFGTFSYGF